MTVSDFISSLERVSLVLAVGILVVIIYFIARRAFKR
jgi:hypothetical protein